MKPPRFDFDNADDVKLAASIFANVVGSEAWDVVRQLALYIRERDLARTPDTLEGLAALNGRQAGMKHLLDTMERMAKVATADASIERSTAASIIASIGAGPVQ